MPEENPSMEEFEKHMAEGSKTPADKLAEAAAKGDKKDKKQQAPDPQVEVAALKEEIKSLEDKCLRVMAEMQNLRTRTEKEIGEARKYGITSFARDLITVMEHMQMAMASIPPEKIEQDELFKNLYTGIKLTADELQTVFKKHGIERISPEGQKFDHNFHQAMVEIPTAEAEPGTVVQVMQAGYTIFDRLIRPALVGVAKAQ